MFCSVMFFDCTAIPDMMLSTMEKDSFRQSRFSYLVDEKMISEQVGFEVEHPIRVFTLGGLGIDTDLFLRELAPTFSLVEVDEYLMKLAQVNFLKSCFPHAGALLDNFLLYYYAGRATLEEVYDLVATLSFDQRHEFDRLRIKGTRARTISRYLLSYEPQRRIWDILRVPVQPFAQSVGTEDIRSFPRVFQETSRVVSNHPEFRKFLNRTASIVQEIRPGAVEIEMTLHQMCIYSDVLGEATNSPEGTHQDGAAFIVSALVVERAGVLGGESEVSYQDADRQVECLKRPLQPGEGLFQADRNTPLWHTVSAVREDPSIPPEYGHRSIFGLDINVLRE